MVTVNNSRYSHGGKGDSIRPTNHKRYSDNYDLIFGKKNVDTNDNYDILQPVQSEQPRLGD